MISNSRDADAEAGSDSLILFNGPWSLDAPIRRPTIRIPRSDKLEPAYLDGTGNGFSE